jgi:hypothetical protein
VGQNHHRLEKRISAALLSGRAQPGEAIFLHKISTQISAYGRNARLSDAQAHWLFKLLDRLKPTRPQSSARAQALKPLMSPEPTHSEGFAISEAYETSSLKSTAHQPLPDPIRKTSPPPQPGTSRPPQGNPPELPKPTSPPQTPSNRPETAEITEGWAIQCLAKMEARRKQRRIWMERKAYRKLFFGNVYDDRDIPPKESSSN